MVDYWRRRDRYAQGRNLNARYLITLQNKLGISYDRNLSIEERIVNRKTEAMGTRKRIIEAADSKRREHRRNQVAMAREAEGKGKIASIIRSMEKLELLRKLFRNIKYMEGKTRGGCTNQVTVTAADGTKTEYTSREDVESQIIKETEKKYHQTETRVCQFLTQEFRDLFGEFREGPATQDVLNGTFDIPATASDATTDFLQACQYADGATTIQRDLPIEIRYHEYAKSWKVRKEKMTSYNQLMGHYKSVMTDNYLSWFFFQASEIPEISGYSPESYRHCAVLTILKKALDFELSKHRTIGLLDTRFNHMNKRIGYSAMKNAIKLDLLAVEQFSRPGRSAIAQCISSSRRLTFSMTSCDLAGYYDRIVHTAAALALLCIGVLHAKIECMFSSSY